MYGALWTGFHSVGEERAENGKGIGWKETDGSNIYIYNRRQQSKKLRKNERSERKRKEGGREIKGEIERRKGGFFLFCVSHNGDGFCRTVGREGGRE